VTTLEKPPGSFDGAFFGRSLHHVPGRVLRIATLRRLARALSPDGVLILMVVYREGRGLLSRSRLVDAARRIGRAVGVPLSEPGDGYMRDVSEGGDSARLCFFHHYDRPADVGDELRAAGFAAQEAAPCWWVCRPAPEPLC
jgi:SAM-dependent methyltransferase